MMDGQALRDARRYEELYEKNIKPELRPVFHLTPRVGWLNDPNGFSYYQDKYHMFYQYYPYASRWGDMHWGHAVSDDLLHWTWLAAALAPDEFYDYNGCFSGSAITMKDGRQLLMYTGVRQERGKDGSIIDVQTQNVAVGDGIDYEKYTGNPVIDESLLPHGASSADFRDPKMLRLNDGTLLALIANRSEDESGQILVFSSQDGFHWRYERVLIRNENRFGGMWECPDFFELDGKWVLLVSPLDMLPQGFEYHNGNGTLCLIGNMESGNMQFTEETDQAIDYGIDFYAPQTVLTPDGRRVMIGWMQNWDACAMREPKEPWAGQMTLPRELSILNGRLYQWPVRELEKIRCGEVRYEQILISGERRLEGIHGRILDMEIEIAPVEHRDSYRKFSVLVAQNELYHTGISYRPYEGTLKINRKFSGSKRAIVHQRRAKVNTENGRLRLRILLDRFSVEVFINGGEKTMTATLYTDPSADGILFIADGEVMMNVAKWNLAVQ